MIAVLFYICLVDCVSFVKIFLRGFSQVTETLTTDILVEVQSLFFERIVLLKLNFSRWAFATEQYGWEWLLVKLRKVTIEGTNSL